MKRNMPSLGFPEEFWDRDGDLFCRPRPDLVATIIGRAPSYTLEMNRYNDQLLPNEKEDHLHPEVKRLGPVFGHLYYSWLCSNGIDIWEGVDGPLHALAIIQHFLSQNAASAA